LGPRGSDTIPISSGLFQGLLPRIPNLELGYIYSFGPDVRAGRATVDYLLPINLGSDSTVFGEAHAEFQSFWQARSGGTDNRVDLSFGGGYRTILRDTTLVGLNGFYDTSRLFGSWYSSGGLGLEMAAITPGDGAIDLNFNWYGNLFTRNGLIDAFRNKGGSFDIEAGYSHPLFNQALDLRLKLTGYKFDIGNNVYGWRTGADVTTRDGVFTVKYEYGRDRVNGSYNSIGGFVNIGMQLENIFSGQSPFVNPEPVFQSPRNLRRMLTQKVKRDWHQPSVVRANSNSTGGCSLPIVRHILNTRIHDDCHAYFIPWDEGVGVSPECLAKVSEIVLTGYYFVSPPTTMYVQIGDVSTNSTELQWIYNSGPIGPPATFTAAAAELAALSVTAEGLWITPTANCFHMHKVTDIVITFVP